MQRKKLRTILRDRIAQGHIEKTAVIEGACCNTCPYRFDPLLDRKEAGLYMGFEPETLATWDYKKSYDLEPIKFHSAVRYRLSTINKLVDQRLRP